MSDTEDNVRKHLKLPFKEETDETNADDRSFNQKMDDLRTLQECEQRQAEHEALLRHIQLQQETRWDTQDYLNNLRMQELENSVRSKLGIPRKTDHDQEES